MHPEVQALIDHFEPLIAVYPERADDIRRLCCEGTQLRMPSGFAT